MTVFAGTHKELSDDLGVTERHLYRQLKQENSGIKKLKNGLYQIEDGDDLEKGTVVNFAEWRAKKMKEDALKSKREREILEGTLLSRDDVLKQLGTAFHTTKASLLTIPNTIAGIVAVETNANVEEILDLGFDKVQIVAAIPQTLAKSDLRKKEIIVASEYEKIATEFLKKENYNFVFLRTYGATEVFPPEDADMIIDNTSTGRTLK